MSDALGRLVTFLSSIKREKKKKRSVIYYSLTLILWKWLSNHALPNREQPVRNQQVRVCRDILLTSLQVNLTVSRLAFCSFHANFYCDK